jgi:hypothetical protein
LAFSLDKFKYKYGTNKDKYETLQPLWNISVSRKIFYQGYKKRKFP